MADAGGGCVVGGALWPVEQFSCGPRSWVEGSGYGLGGRRLSRAQPLAWYEPQLLRPDPGRLT